MIIEVTKYNVVDKSVTHYITIKDNGTDIFFGLLEELRDLILEAKK